MSKPTAKELADRLEVMLQSMFAITHDDAQTMRDSIDTLRTPSAELQKYKTAPLCADHAELWYCDRNTLTTKTGCIWCDKEVELQAAKALKAERDELKRQVAANKAQQDADRLTIKLTDKRALKAEAERDDLQRKFYHQGEFAKTRITLLQDRVDELREVLRDVLEHATLLPATRERAQKLLIGESK